MSCWLQNWGCYIELTHIWYQLTRISNLSNFRRPFLLKDFAVSISNQLFSIVFCKFSPFVSNSNERAKITTMPLIAWAKYSQLFLLPTAKIFACKHMPTLQHIPEKIWKLHVWTLILVDQEIVKFFIGSLKQPQFIFFSSTVYIATCSYKHFEL